MVVEGYPLTSAGAESFTTEVAGLAFTSGFATGPRLLTASPQARVVVMSDLGSGPSLADVLLTGPTGAATAMLSWAQACGKLAVRRLGEIPALLTGRSIAAPPGLAADLAEVASILTPGRHEVFRPVTSARTTTC